MTDQIKQLSFRLELTKEESLFAKRLLHACEALVAAAGFYGDRSDLQAIYADPKSVPADLVEHVRRIDPIRYGRAGISVSPFTDLVYGEHSCLTIRNGHFVDDFPGSGLWVCHEGTANVGFVAAWLQEVIRKFGQLEPIGFQWSRELLKAPPRRSWRRGMHCHEKWSEMA